MSMRIENTKIYISIPNSEASINAQHHGIKDRSVGSYYMSENYFEIKDFLSNFNGDYYIDFLRVYNNTKKLVEFLIQERLEVVFKTNLVTQKAALETIEWLIEQKRDLLKISPPNVNEHTKYLKFSLDNQYIKCMRDLCLGELTQIVIERLSTSCYIIYVEDNGMIEQLIENGTVQSWMR